MIDTIIGSLDELLLVFPTSDFYGRFKKLQNHVNNSYTIGTC